MLKKWENVAWGSTIFIVLTFLPPFLDIIGFSFWLKSVCIIAVLFGVLSIVSKIKILQKQITNKVCWLSLISAFIFVTVLSEFVFK
jgi:FtsH-binding integral membrane protein